MTLHQVLQSGRKVKRPSYDFYLREVNGLLTPDKAMKNFELTVEDMRAADWEVEEVEVETSLELNDKVSKLGMFKLKPDTYDLVIAFYIERLEDSLDFEATEKDIDKLLTFLYNNTEIGKKRVIPF